MRRESITRLATRASWRHEGRPTAEIVTFVFTDVEGSTKLLHELGAEAYAGALAEHRRLLREAVEATRRRRARHAGRCVLRRVRRCTGSDRGGGGRLGGTPRRARSTSESGSTPGRRTWGRGLRRRGRPSRRADRRGRSRRAGPVSDRPPVGDSRSSVLDLGEHRLKDFEQPVRILQLGSERFPPLKTISNTNLPRPASSFVGRGREVEEVVALIRDGARLVTLTGPGGSGKTRLSIIRC